MTSREQITRAQSTDDLSEVGLEDIGDVDIVRACGMAGQGNPLGLAIWRWRYGGDHRELPHVAMGLIERGFEADVVAKVLGHLADDVCRHCEGRGYEAVPDTPMLSDIMCVHCQGTGRRPLRGEAELAVAETIARLEREIAGAIMRKLARQMDF